MIFIDFRRNQQLLQSQEQHESGLALQLNHSRNQVQACWLPNWIVRDSLVLVNCLSMARAFCNVFNCKQINGVVGDGVERTNTQAMLHRYG